MTKKQETKQAPEAVQPQPAAVQDGGAQTAQPAQEQQQTAQEPSVFDTLYAVNCSEHIEKKEVKNKKTGQVRELSYLSWAWAWAEVKKRYPNATYKIYERPDGVNYWTDGRTCWVKTGVTIDGLEHIEYLPVMDYLNISIPLGNVTSMDVNKAIQRSLTKACGRHGLGLYIYAGEDLPETEAEALARQKLQEEQAKKNAETLEHAFNDAVQRVNACTRVEDLKTVYESYPAFKDSKPFKAAINKRAKEINEFKAA